MDESISVGEGCVEESVSVGKGCVEESISVEEQIAEKSIPVEVDPLEDDFSWGSYTLKKKKKLPRAAELDEEERHNQFR